MMFRAWIRRPSPPIGIEGVEVVLAIVPTETGSRFWRVGAVYVWVTYRDTGRHLRALPKDDPLYAAAVRHAETPAVRRAIWADWDYCPWPGERAPGDPRAFPISNDPLPEGAQQ